MHIFGDANYADQITDVDLLNVQKQKREHVAHAAADFAERAGMASGIAARFLKEEEVALGLQIPIWNFDFFVSTHALDDGVVLVKRCGYFFLNWSSRSHVNSGPLLEFHRTLTNGIRLRFNRLTSRPTISTGSSTKWSLSSKLSPSNGTANVARNKETQVLETVPFEQQDDDLKKKLTKNNEAKMVLYNALPKKEYERIFMCKTTKDIWQSLLITHHEESIYSGFARFNTIITSLKALDEGLSSKNYVRKFLRALHPKWRAKVMIIEELKDFSSLALDELIGNLKVHEVVMEKDSEIYKGKKEWIKSIAMKAKKESSDDETLTSGSDDEEYAMAVRNFKKFFRRKGKFVRQPREEKKSFRQRDEKKGKSDRKCFRCGDPNHLIGDCPKPSRNKDQKAFIGGSWSDSENDAEDKTNDETCLMAQSSNEVTLNSSCYSDNASSLDNDNMQIEYDSLCEISLKIINKNKF
ncbi:zf-CCHC domain-containing protein [Tanacetum coccineum]